MKAGIEETLALKIDYETFNTDEIIIIFDFFNKIYDFVKLNRGNKKDLINSYNMYRKVLNSISFEKRYNNMYEKQTGIKIYQTMRDIMN